jgi:hypothetical protein
LKGEFVVLVAPAPTRRQAAAIAELAAEPLEDAEPDCTRSQTDDSR